MDMLQQRCAAVILMGGSSRRMGQKKADLLVGGISMLERTRAALADFCEVLLSVGEDMPEKQQLRCIPDVFHDSGPLSGIHATLSASGYEMLFYVPCDLPNFSAELPRLMLSAMPPEADALVCRDSTGRFHPLCGIYRARILPQLEASLRAGEFRVMRFLETVNWQPFDTAPHLPDSVFLNMNSPETYRDVCGNVK